MHMRQSLWFSPEPKVKLRITIVIVIIDIFSIHAFQNINTLVVGHSNSIYAVLTLDYIFLSCFFITKFLIVLFVTQVVKVIFFSLKDNGEVFTTQTYFLPHL